MNEKIKKTLRNFVENYDNFKNFGDNIDGTNTEKEPIKINIYLWVYMYLFIFFIPVGLICGSVVKILEWFKSGN